MNIFHILNFPQMIKTKEAKTKIGQFFMYPVYAKVIKLLLKKN